jgi:hypothetical protein
MQSPRMFSYSDRPNRRGSHDRIRRKSTKVQTLLVVCTLTRRKTWVWIHALSDVLLQTVWWHVYTGRAIGNITGHSQSGRGRHASNENCVFQGFRTVQRDAHLGTLPLPMCCQTNSQPDVPHRPGTRRVRARRYRLVGAAAVMAFAVPMSHAVLQMTVPRESKQHCISSPSHGIAGVCESGMITLLRPKQQAGVVGANARHCVCSQGHYHCCYGQGSTGTVDFEAWQRQMGAVDTASSTDGRSNAEGPGIG